MVKLYYLLKRREKSKIDSSTALKNIQKQILQIENAYHSMMVRRATDALINAIKKYTKDPYDITCQDAIEFMLTKQMFPYTDVIGVDGLTKVVRAFNDAESNLTKQYSKNPEEIFYQDAIQFMQNKRLDVYQQLIRLQSQQQLNNT